MKIFIQFASGNRAVYNTFAEFKKIILSNIESQRIHDVYRPKHIIYKELPVNP